MRSGKGFFCAVAENGNPLCDRSFQTRAALQRHIKKGQADSRVHSKGFGRRRGKRAATGGCTKTSDRLKELVGKSSIMSIRNVQEESAFQLTEKNAYTLITGRQVSLEPLLQCGFASQQAR